MNGMKEDGEGEGFPLSMYDYGFGIGEAQGFGSGDGGHGFKVGPNEVIIDREINEIDLEIFETKAICAIRIIDFLPWTQPNVLEHIAKINKYMGIF